MKSTTFNQIIADATKVPVASVTVFTRNLREAGLLTDGGRGQGAAHMTPLDASRVLIALMATDKPARAVEMVKRFGSMTFEAERSSSLDVAKDATFEAVFASWLEDFERLSGTATSVAVNVNGRRAEILSHRPADGGANPVSTSFWGGWSDADRIELMGLRVTRALAAAELCKVAMIFYLEAREGQSYEEIRKKHEGQNHGKH